MLLDVKKNKGCETEDGKTFAFKMHRWSFMARWPTLFKVSEVRHFMVGYSVGFTVDTFYHALSPF